MSHIVKVARCVCAYVCVYAHAHSTGVEVVYIRAHAQVRDARQAVKEREADEAIQPYRWMRRMAGQISMRMASQLVLLLSAPIHAATGLLIGLGLGRHS